MDNQPTEREQSASRLDQELSWLGSLITPVYEQMTDARVTYERAMKEAEAAKAKLDLTTSQFENLLTLASTNGLSRAAVEEYCQAAHTRKVQEASLPPEYFGKRRVRNLELMVVIARAIKAAGAPLGIDDILDVIERERIFLPGKEPRANLLAYISRSPLIQTVKRGLYNYNPELLAAAELELSEEHGQQRIPGTGGAENMT